MDESPPTESLKDGNEQEENPIISLGAVNSGVIRRLANYIQSFLKADRKPPRSKFAMYVAARITGVDKQDAVCMVTGRRGSGKSYSCLYLGWRIAKGASKNFGQV